MSANREQNLDQLWVNEALDRLDAYDRGDLEAISAEEVFDEMDQQGLMNEVPHRSSTVNFGFVACEAGASIKPGA